MQTSCFWLQDCYPERLGKMLIVHAPYMFMKIWKMIYPFIDDNTKKKVTLQIYNAYYICIRCCRSIFWMCCTFIMQIVFVENKKLKSTLLEEIEESQIPDIYGGQMPLVPIQNSWLKSLKAFLANLFSPNNFNFCTRS